MTDAQLPSGGQIFLDHIGHFVPDIDAAAAALERCGFLLTPFSVQTAPTGPEGALQPTGTGNVCTMLRAGYLEFLTKTAETPLAAELEAAFARWAGVHLAAFAVAQPEAAYDRLLRAGIDMRSVVHMRRPVETEGGMSEARFTVLRPKPGVMPEGRIQLLTHHTEKEVWQHRWLDHPNGVLGLLGVLIVTDDLDGAATRFQRLLGVNATKHSHGIRFTLDRGHVELRSPNGAEAVTGRPPGLPWIAAYGLKVESLDRTARHMNEADLQTNRNGKALIAQFPSALGVGYWVFVKDARDLPWNETANQL
jgi:hypothetical protein